MPGSDDDGQWDVYELVEEAQAAIAGGLRRDGFGTAAFNACTSALNELLGTKTHLLDAQQRELIRALRQAVVDLA